MTRAKLTGMLGVFLTVVVAIRPGRADDIKKPQTPKTSQPYVVLVGIGDYADKQIKPRPRAEADVKALYDLFTKKEYLGVDADHIRLLLGSDDPSRKSQKATRDNILKALN